MKNFYKNKRILITGVSGFVGKSLVHSLLNQGAKISGTYLNNKPSFKKKIKLFKVDLRLLKNCKKVCKNIDYIFMCSANSSGAQIIEKKPLNHLTPNILMNTLMLEAAYLNKVKKFCFISSSTVYPNIKKKISEKDVNYQFFKKYYIVGWMKLFSEKLCQMYSKEIEKPMQTLVVRPSNLYGPHDKFDKEKAKVVPSLIRKVAEKNFPIEIWGDGNDLKDFIFIDDFIDALLKIFKSKNEGGPINISYGKSYTIKQMFKILIDISGNKNIKVRYDSTKPTMIPKRQISNNLIKKHFNWKPKVDLKKGLKITYSWFLNQKR